MATARVTQTQSTNDCAGCPTATPTLSSIYRYLKWIRMMSAQKSQLATDTFTKKLEYATMLSRKKKEKKNIKKKNIQLALMGLHWVFASKMLQGQMRAQGATPRHGPYLRMEIQTWSSRQSHLEGYSQVQKQKTVGDFRTFAYFPAISFSLGRNPTYFPIIV